MHHIDIAGGTWAWLAARWLAWAWVSARWLAWSGHAARRLAGQIFNYDKDTCGRLNSKCGKRERGILHRLPLGTFLYQKINTLSQFSRTKMNKCTHKYLAIACSIFLNFGDKAVKICARITEMELAIAFKGITFSMFISVCLWWGDSIHSLSFEEEWPVGNSQVGKCYYRASYYHETMVVDITHGN